jgi:hypothetical protein
MTELKDSFTKAYDTIMSKLGIESFCIQWNHAYTSDYKRHFHLVLSQTKLPIHHAVLEVLPFPFRKFIIVDPTHKPHTKDYEDYIKREYTKFFVP